VVLKDVWDSNYKQYQQDCVGLTPPLDYAVNILGDSANVNKASSMAYYGLQD